MAVYKRSYHRYEGALTPEWSRFFVITRYIFEDMRRRRILSWLYLASFAYPVITAILIYLMHNLSVFTSLGLPPPRFLSIDSHFFLHFLGIQSMLAMILAFFIGPGLVSPDLTNNALALYLSRPFSRVEYVLGKGSVLLILLSLMTWIPGLLLYGFQSWYEGWAWFQANFKIATGLFLGATIWILFLTLLSLALSAWVRWRPVAAALLFGIIFVSAGFSEAINNVMGTRWGHLINVTHLVGSVWVSLFDEPVRRGAGAVFFRVARGEEIPVWICWLMLMAICTAALAMLERRIRGVEIVR